MAQMPFVTDGFEIEIIVRSRKGTSPSGKAGHVVVTCGDRISLNERQTIASTLESAARDIIAARQPQ